MLQPLADTHFFGLRLSHQVPMTYLLTRKRPKTFGFPCQRKITRIHDYVVLSINDWTSKRSHLLLTEFTIASTGSHLSSTGAKVAWVA